MKKKAVIATISSGKALLFGLDGKRIHDWFNTESEAVEYAKTHDIKLPPFNRRFEDILDNYVIASPWPRHKEQKEESLIYFIEKHERASKSDAQQVIARYELELIYKIAHRAIVLSPALSEKNNVLQVASALEVCHVLYHRLRLAEMAETNDGASLLHDVWLILRSINHEKSKWDNVISPKFAEGDSEQGAQP